MTVEDLVQERIAAARRKIANDKRRREELAEARKHGLAARHAQKLARLSRYTPGPRETPAGAAATSNRRDTPTVATPSEGAANDSPPSGKPVATPTPSPLTGQHPARVRGTGLGSNSLTHARETEIGDAR